MQIDIYVVWLCQNTLQITKFCHRMYVLLSAVDMTVR